MQDDFGFRSLAVGENRACITVKEEQPSSVIAQVARIGAALVMEIVTTFYDLTLTLSITAV